MKRKHAELIHAWADGAEIQFRVGQYSEWRDCLDIPAWKLYLEYRIKPAPKPDDVYYANCSKGVVSAYCIEKFRNANLRLTFCAETGKLKSAEVL